MTLFEARMPSLPKAACRGADINDFYPDWDTGRPKNSARSAFISEAMGLCGMCPERLKCLQWALDNNEQGIWGGTTEEDRRAMQKKPLTQEQRRRRVRQLHKDGLNDRQIGSKLGIDRRDVYNDRRILGLPSNHDDTEGLEEQRDNVAELHALGFNDYEIGARLGIKRDAVRRARLARELPAVSRKKKNEDVA